MRTYREIKILRHLINHENIITVRDVFLDTNNKNKNVFIVFDYMDTDLKRVLESNQTLTNDHIKYFSYQILNGLAFIHQAGIVRRKQKKSRLFLLFCFLPRFIVILSRQIFSSVNRVILK